MKHAHTLSLLHDISIALEKSIDLTLVMQPIIDTITDRAQLLRGAIALVDKYSGEIAIDVASGMLPHQKHKGIYQIGEGITGQVVASGKQEIIPDITQDSRFLNRTGIAVEKLTAPVSFICIPIKIKTETIGTFSAHLSAPASTLQDSARFFTIVSSMIAQAVQLRREFLAEHRYLQAENTRLQRELVERFRPSNIIGTAACMHEVFDMIAQVCRSNATVLIRGESGTGKELVAQAIHYNSHRKHKPFIRVNCGALPESVIESELFGHEKGAFTGALEKRKGRFELAHNGTIFLDEIGDFPLTLQIKILRVLQEREFERVGGNETIRANVRVITATNHNLERLMGERAFREDLYYRLNVFPIHLPPLRERKSDILLLADHFVAKYNKANGKGVKRISTPAIDMLTNYHWPGNVRELENCIERAVLLTPDDVIHGQHLPPTLQSAEHSETQAHNSLQEILDSVEYDMIVDALKTTKGHAYKASLLLKVSYRIFGLRLKKYSINPKKYR